MAKKKLTLEDVLVPKEEIPYEVPENWCWIKLEGMADCLDKFRKPINATERSKREGNIPYYGATGQVGWIDDYLLDEEVVLVGEDGAPFFELLKDKAYMIEGKSWVNNHAHVLKSKFGSYSNKYLMNYLNIFDYNGYVNGTTRLKLTQKKMLDIPIPIPPLAEQERIVKRIESLFEKVDKARELVDEARDGFEKRRSAILEKAFCGELTANSEKYDIEDNLDLSILNKDSIEFDVPYELSNGWKWIKFNECCTFLGSGVTPKGGSSVYTEEGIPFIRSQNVLKGSLDMSDVVYISEEIQEKMKRTTVKPKDTLLNITGASIGRCSYVPDEIEVANVNQHVCILRFKDYIDYKYPSYWINSPTFQNIINKEQIGATRQALNFKQLRGMWIPVPPIEDQRKIVDTLDRLIEKEREIEALSDMVSNCEVIKKSILAKAFRGELGSNNLEEESSLELLKELMK